MDYKVIDYGGMRYKVAYDNILKASSEGYKCQCRDIAYKYDVNSKYLDNIKKIYLLDGFAQIKSENDMQTFINATNWVSLLLLSDKMPTIEQISSYELIQNVCRGVYAANCYAHAVVLNDVLLALGYISKYVFCMPVDYHFVDNHVVNLIFSKQLKKWVLFDAAQNLYYTDENEVPLNLCELRTRLIEGRVINTCLLDVYWADLTLKEKLMYQNKNLIYMTKNMYRFSAYENSYLDRLAGNREVLHYNLVPNQYMQTPFKQVFYDMETATKHIEIYTSDAEKFWSNPEENENDAKIIKL